MKRFTLIVVLFISHHVFAQSKPNVLKINIGSLAVKNIALQYEHALGNKKSLAVGLRIGPGGTLAMPLQNYLIDKANDPNLNIGNVRISNFAISPEFRFYFKQSLKGFYIAPYTRYAYYSITAPVIYQSTLSQKTAFFSGSISSFSGGILIGNQFALGKKCTLDLWIFGGHFGASTGNLHFTASLTPQEQQEIRQTLENADIPLFNIEYDINSSGGTINSKGAWLGFRGLALNFGYRF